MFKRTILSIALISGILCVRAGFIEDARQAALEGQYAEAREYLEKALEENPAAAENANYLYVEGVCLYHEGDYGNALPSLERAKAKGNGLANLYLGRLAFLDYDFKKASNLFDEFKRYRAKLGQVAGEDVAESEIELGNALNALERVRKIEIIDSIAVPADDFFKGFKLPYHGGRIIMAADMPSKLRKQAVNSAFINEYNNYMIWGDPDSVGNMKLVESEKLIDAEWSDPKPLSETLDIGRYVEYPFMLDDGVTLYFAAEGEESMGGYDIFMATRDPMTGEYLQPVNVGMPFNSPFDDFLMVIDEDAGVGWWATDRNQLEDKITIYVFITDDVRTNYESDEPDLISLARISDYKSTQNPEKTEFYRNKLKEIDRNARKVNVKEPEFTLKLDDLTEYTTFSDFKNSNSAKVMKELIAAQKMLKEKENSLNALYKRYPVNKADNVKDEILDLETEIEAQRTKINKLQIQIYNLEAEAR